MSGGFSSDRVSLQGVSGGCVSLQGVSGGLGDVEHAQTLVFVQQLVLGADLFSERAQSALLKRGTQLNPRRA